REIKGVRHQAGFERSAVTVGKLQHYFRMRCFARFDEGVEQCAGQRRVDTKIDPALNLFVVGVQQTRQLLNLPQDSRSLAEENFPGGGWSHAARNAPQQRYAHPLLELGNLLAQSWLCHVNCGGGSRKAACFDGFYKIAEVPELH